MPSGMGPKALEGGFPKITGTFLEGPHNKDYSVLGSPYFGKLPEEVEAEGAFISALKL